MGAQEIAKRAMELAARAEELARHAHETAGIDEQLAQLEAELDALDAEEAGLLADDPDDTREDSGAPPHPDQQSGSPPGSLPGSLHWADLLTDRVGSLGDRIGLLVEQVTDAAMQRVEATLAADAEETTEEHTVDVAGPGAVRIQSHAGSVRVAAHAASTVSVVARGRLIGGQRRLVDVEVHDGTVTVKTRIPGRLRGRGVRLEVGVPVATALAVTTGAGSVRAHGVHGPAEVRTGGGSIELTDVDGAVSAHTGGGAITVEGQLAGTSSLRTGGGNITVAVAAGTNVRVDGRGTGCATDIETLTAHRGRVSGHIGDGTGGELDARTGGGAIRVVRATTAAG
jgi:hypothetical protein